jgi:hypothetical protein
MSHEDNKSVFDNERVFRTNKERSVVGGKETANRIAENKGPERCSSISQFQPAKEPRIRQNEELNQKDLISDMIENFVKLENFLNLSVSTG